MLATIYFLLFAAICLVSGVVLLLSRHPLNGAMALVVNMLSLAGLYAVLASPFLGVIQILVYAGAIVMLVVFVIMVLNGARDGRLPRMDRLGILILPAALAVGLLIAGAVYASPLPMAEDAVRGTVAVTAAHLFDTSHTGPGYFILFEVVGLVLLSAIVGAVLLSKRRLDSAPTPPSQGGH